MDAKDQPLDGGKTYRLRLPPNIPAKEFWSLVLYDNQTRSMLQTDQQFPSIGSQKKGVAINPDTSVDVYFGPKAPPGKESNWVQTWPGKGWNVILRLYGPCSRCSTRPGGRARSRRSTERSTSAQGANYSGVSALGRWSS